MFKDFKKEIQKLQNEELEVGTSRGSLSIQQTQRNNKKSELVEAFYKGMKELEDDLGVQVYITNSGPIIEILNEKVENQVLSKDQSGICNGMISIEFDLKVKNLDFDAATEEKEYLFKQQQKEIKRQKAEEKREAKIKRDAEIRAEKSRIREQKLEKYLKENEE